MNMIRILPTALCLLLPLAAQAGPSDTGFVDVRRELADARKEVRWPRPGASWRPAT